jgi:hypothetical protein
MRRINFFGTNIGSSLSKPEKGENYMKTTRMFKVLMLAGLIATLASLADAQSNGRWIGRIQISPSTTGQSPASVIDARSGAEGTISQEADQVGVLSVSPSGKKSTIVGSWLLTVNIPDNAPPFDLFKALWCLTGDGILVASAQGDITPTPFPAATSAYGAWAQRGGRQFAASFISVLYDVQSGENMGSFKLRQTITLNDSGDEWNGPFKLNVFDPDGNVVAVVNGTAHAKRITVEPLD